MKTNGQKKQAEAYQALIAQCAAYVAETKPAVRKPEEAYRLLAPLMRGEMQEGFYVILLNTKNKAMMAPIQITKGILDSATVHPRETFRPAVQHAAAAIIIAHNHPSGDPTPSPEDVAITKRLVEAGNVLGIKVIDHLIVGEATEARPAFCSLRECGLVTF